MNSNYCSDYKPVNSCQRRQILAIMTGFFLSAVLTGCNTVTTTQYEATAQTTMTWAVRYFTDPSRKQERIETFASTSLINRNGEKPEDAVIGPDEKELWWPALPPRPTLDEIEQRQQPAEQFSNPEVLRTVEYQLTYHNGSETVTLPTNYDVYREVTKVYGSQQPLQLTLGVGDGSITKAEPLSDN